MAVPRIAASLAIDARSETYDRVIATLPSSGDARHHLTTIEADLRAIELSTIYLRKRRNAFTPIGRLPPDVLALVFGFVALFDPLIGIAPLTARHPLSELEVPLQNGRALRWVTVTHACSMWRTVALEDTRLWSEVPHRLGLPWVNEILRRRGPSRGLIVEYTKGTQRQDDELDAILPMLQHNFHRIEDLRVAIGGNADAEHSDTSRVLHDALLRVMDSPAPRLRVLLWHTDHIAQPAWPQSLLAGRSPKLTEVYLDVYPTPHPTLGPADIYSSLMPFIPQLTRLNMNLQAQETTEIDRLELIYRVLSVAARLEFFHIRGHLFEPRDAEQAADSSLIYPPLDLPCMQELRIIAPITGTSALMSLLMVPDACTVEAGCYVDRRTLGEAAGCLRMLSDSFHDRFSSIYTLELAAYSLPEPHLAFSGWNTRSCEFLLEDFTPFDDGDRPPPRLMKRPSPNISITFRECPKCDDNLLKARRYFLTKLLGLLAIPLSGLENLSLRVSDTSDQVTYPSPDWTFVRESFQYLQWLRVDRYIALQLLRQQWNIDEPILAPSVAHIVLIGIEWWPSQPNLMDHHQRKECLHRLLSVGSDTSESIRSIAIGGRAGGSQEALAGEMPEIPFTVLHGVAHDGDSDYEDAFEMYH